MAKAMTHFTNAWGTSPVNNYILLFDGHNSHFDDGTIRQIMCKNIQLFVLKPGESVNYQPNDNGPNAKLKSLYNVENSVWIMKYGTTKFSLHHMNSVLVEAWFAFMMSSVNIIRDILAKQSYFPSALPT